MCLTSVLRDETNTIVQYFPYDCVVQTVAALGTCMQYSHALLTLKPTVFLYSVHPQLLMFSAVKKVHTTIHGTLQYVHVDGHW